jgi:hypothetical protein
VQRTSHRCPHCYQPLRRHSDMWGPYYLCEDCGWTAEDDEHLSLAGIARSRVPHHVLTVGEASQAWESRRHPR